MSKWIFCCVAAMGLLVCRGGGVTVDPGRAEIVCPEPGNAILNLASEELQKHLRLMTGVTLPVRSVPTAGWYSFQLVPPAGTVVPPDREAAYVKITPSAAYLYGEDNLGTDKRQVSRNEVFLKLHRTGTLFAVYEFLEKQLGVLWTEPGDRGIVYVPRKMLTLETGDFAWKPSLIQRELRRGISNRYEWYLKENRRLEGDFQWSREEFEQKLLDIKIWLKRQRMGNSYYFGYGHAYTSWWKKYGKDHPEYFAMQKDGVRRPEYAHLPDRCKMCVTSPEFQNKILELYGGMRFINICENDSGGYCRCPRCMALDAPEPGEQFDDHLTDRYVWFANQIQEKAAKINPETQVVFYAYACYRFPPRKTKLDSRVIVGFVPSMLELDKVEKMYREWQKMGLKNVFLRPNDHHIACGLPMGYDRQLFDHFQLGVKYGIIGTDYDSLHNFWPVGGMADYILARAHIDPTRSFEHWEEEYCRMYGAAAPQVRAYYAYWREQIWQKRLMKDRENIMKIGRYGNFRRGLMWNLGRYYRPEDFAETDALLARGMKQNLTPAEKARLENLKLANEHARLTYEAVVAPGNQKFTAGRKLLDFRLKHRDDLRFDWIRLTKLENDFGDVTGMQLAAKFREYEDSRALPLGWQFQIDDKNLGEKEQWEKFSAGRIDAVWEPIRVDRAWEKQTSSGMTPELRKKLRNYDGIGYYALQFQVPRHWKGRSIALYFGAVDESAWIYVNGRPAGQRIFSDPDDWQKPFFIPVDKQIDWSKQKQLVVVRVEDKAGAGGIWRPVYLVMK